MGDVVLLLPGSFKSMLLMEVIKNNVVNASISPQMEVCETFML